MADEVTEIELGPAGVSVSAGDDKGTRRRDELVSRFARIRVPESLTALHPLTTKTMRCFELIKRERERWDATKPKPRTDRWEPDFSDLRGPQAKYGRFTPSIGAESVALTVSFQALDRAVRIADTLVKVLESEGFEVLPRMHKDGTRITKDGEYVAFRISEGYVRPAAMRGASPVASGTLDVVCVGGNTCSEKRWSDRNQSLEKQIPEIIAGLVLLHSQQKSLREQRQAQNRARASEACALAVGRRRNERETEELRILIEEAELFEVHRRMKAYLAAIDRRAEGMGGEDRTCIQMWVAGQRQILESRCPVSLRVARILRRRSV
ncbi:MAG: hypothetical protein ACM3SS_05515 [Rhodospirillaceae bacterium]